MDLVLDRIAGRRAELAEQAERLRKELAEVEAELARVGTAEQVVIHLLASQDDGTGGEQERTMAGQRPAALMVPQRSSRIRELRGKRCSAHTAQSEPYFRWHRDNVFRG